LAVNKLASDGIGIELLACDDRADNVTAAREALALAEAKVDVIIGPLLSNVAATAAAALSCHNIPLLVPAATQAGFTDLSPACFQLLPNLETVGRGMAQYAVKYRGMKTLAVMTPATPDETTMAESFSSEARRLGANILAIERFHPEETDFGPFLLDIKKLLLGRTGDSAVYISLDGDTLTFEEVPVSFDGMFLPLPQQQLFLLLPQLEYYRIMTSYLGTDEWNSPRILRLGQNILRDPVFYSGKAAMRFSDRYPSFAEACRARFGSEPDHLTALGYDVVSLAAEAFQAGRRTPLDIADYLQAVSGYEGMSGRMTFGPARSNLELPLFTLRNWQISPVNEWIKVEPVLAEPTPDEPAENDNPDQEEPQAPD
jgi:ABC-type branched-subunit amino acid transport system substrate-binding protein